MASTIYRRPNLWPFSYTSWPDFSGNPGLAVGGNADQALQLITQIQGMTVTVGWNVFFPQINPASNFTSSFNRTINCETPVPVFSTAYGYYYKDLVGGRWANPAERVLVTPENPASPWPSLNQVFPTVYPYVDTLTVQLRVSKTGSSIQSCLAVTASDERYGVSASLNNPIATTLTSIPLTLTAPPYSISFGNFYLNYNAVAALPPVVNSFSASVSVTF